MVNNFRDFQKAAYTSSGQSDDKLWLLLEAWFKLF